MSQNQNDFCTIQEAIAELRAGKMIVLVDDENRENEGDLVIAAHPEGSVDMPRLAGFKEAAVIIEIMNSEGRMARVPELREYCRQHGLKMCTIEDLIKYRRQRERLIRRELVVQLPTRYGEF